MKMYLLTEQEHAQIVYALNIGIAKHYDLAEDVRIGDVIAMIKVKKPVEPVGYLAPRDRFYKTRMMAVSNFEQIAEPLYAKEQQ